MTRYFFHIVQGDYIIDDEEGYDLPDLDAVREEAVQSAREILAEEIRAEGRIEERSFWVRDEDGKTVLTLPFREALS